MVQRARQFDADEAAIAAASAILNPRSGLEARSKGVDLPQGASLVPKLKFGMGR